VAFIIFQEYSSEVYRRQYYETSYRNKNDNFNALKSEESVPLLDTDRSNNNSSSVGSLGTGNSMNSNSSPRQSYSSSCSSDTREYTRRSTDKMFNNVVTSESDPMFFDMDIN